MQKICSIGPRIRRAGLGGVGLALLLGCAATGALSAEPQVEIPVYGSDDLAAHYDYITWAPAPALVRVVPKPGTTPDATVSVVLTNESPAGGGKGHVNFAPSAEMSGKGVRRDALRPARGHQFVTRYPKARHFVASMPAPVASGWSGCRVGLSPTGKRRLVRSRRLLLVGGKSSRGPTAGLSHRM